MQSQGSTLSQPSFDSLSSSDGLLLLSDSEQAEDDADVFLTDSSSSVVVGEAGGTAAGGDGGSESPGSQWTCDGFTDKEEEEESDRSEGKEARAGKTDPMGQTPKSQGDLLFAQKCAELQGFVRPLLELLNGLKTGRFDRGLSSFQQSVAMDRIQRIVGVLQRPNSGEKYLNTLLQVEMMLKLWFPQIPTQPVSAASSVATSPGRSLQDASGSMPPHKHRDQLHIPVKKRRLSWTGTESTSPSPVLLKCPRISAQEKGLDQDEGDGPAPSPAPASDVNQSSLDVAGDNQLNNNTKERDSDREEAEKLPKYKAGQSSEPSLTWVHVAPILSPRKVSHEATTSAVNGDLTAGRKGSPATQDSSVSSTTPYKQPKSLKKPIQCQSQPVAGPQSENAETCQGQSQPPLHVTLKPLPRVCPTSLET
ncbi:circadian-associated transcriptional repressor-like [Acanthochromis polyacanthus]|uniref:circadian-associated transcriptional repressor-like n=1 Tax=Acanthochromis polyacanthus TaxID=80966 RepID=UPI002234E22C|nr:circadian-associated transcriptional repressor-like [Acanthochromis polyacanthus]XP_051813321.1 circadian-associated transcriptional repressor-like [Acanthochromis polyacanthus]